MDLEASITLWRRVAYAGVFITFVGLLAAYVGEDYRRWSTYNVVFDFLGSGGFGLPSRRRSLHPVFGMHRPDIQISRKYIL